MTTLPTPHLLTVPVDRPGRSAQLPALAPDSLRSPAASPRYNRTALIAGYGDLSPRVQRFLADLLGDRTLAHDATQETFVRALRKVDDLPAGTPVVPWVFGIARRVALELVRARGRGRRVLVAADGGHEHVPDPRARSPEATLLDKEALGVVSEALDKLPEERRAALLLRLDHGLPYEQIAEVMGWTVAKTKVEVFRAREVLRGTFEGWRGGEP